jgi:hypothetical protein
MGEAGGADDGGLGRSYSEMLERSASLFAKEAALLEGGIAYSLSLYSALARTRGLDARMQDLLALFYRNCVYLSASYRLIRAGLLDPAGNNMRTVFETIIWQYAYLTDGEVYENFREMGAMDGEKLRLIKEGKWSNTKERALENLRRKYSFQKMLKKLYSKERYEGLFYGQYWAFCQKSHSSIFGINHNTPNMAGLTTLDSPGGEAEMRGSLSALLYLCAENLMCALNCFSAPLGQEKTGETLKALAGINRAIPASPGLAPDTRAMEFTLRFREA